MMEFNNETYINLIHRMTGYDTDIVEIAIKTLNNQQLANYTIKDIGKLLASDKFRNIEKRMKLQKFIDLSK